MNISRVSTINKILFVAQAPETFYRSSLLGGGKQFFIGPDILASPCNSRDTLTALLTPKLRDGQHMRKLLSDLDFAPDIVFIKADATCRNHIYNLGALPGKKVLLMGDTHHMNKPLQVMLSYARQEPWDLISSEHDRHHLLLFHAAGFRNLLWLPCFTMNPYKLAPSIPTDQRPVFVGSLGSRHIHRQRIIQQLQKLGIPLHVTTAQQNQAALLYNQHCISLNVSLNGDLNFRIMEVLASGGCLLTDRLGPDSGLNQILTEGVHYLAYSSANEAADCIQFLRDHPEKRQSIAEAGFQRFWSVLAPELQSQVLLSALAGQPVPNLFQAPQ